jgi:hypothetical protein
MVAPTELAARERPPVTFDCNECNEALDSARTSIQTAGRLALVARNALINGDARRACVALQELHDATESGEPRGAAPAFRRL